MCFQGYTMSKAQRSYFYSQRIGLLPIMSCSEGRYQLFRSSFSEGKKKMWHAYAIKSFTFIQELKKHFHVTNVTLTKSLFYRWSPRGLAVLKLAQRSLASKTLESESGYASSSAAPLDTCLHQVIETNVLSCTWSPPCRQGLWYMLHQGQATTSQEWRRSGDVISGQYISLSLILIPTPIIVSISTRKPVKCDKCALVTQQVSGKHHSATCNFRKPKNDSIKKIIWLNYLVEITFKANEPVNFKWYLNYPGRRS